MGFPKVNFIVQFDDGRIFMILKSFQLMLLVPNTGQDRTWFLLCHKVLFLSPLMTLEVLSRIDHINQLTGTNRDELN